MTHRVAGVILCIAALVGLQMKIEYSGWLLFIGIVLVL